MKLEDPAQKLYRKKTKDMDLERDVDKFAMWSFFLAIAPVFVLGAWPLLVITIPMPYVALVLGILSLKRINKNDKLKGKGFAIAGIAIASIEIILQILGLFIFLILIGLSIA